jgi:hypothetical protein
VNGECTTDYQITAHHDSGRVKTVLKKKDLSLCKDRSETNLGIPVAHYPTEKVCNAKRNCISFRRPAKLLVSRKHCRWHFCYKHKYHQIMLILKVRVIVSRNFYL